MLGFVIYGIGYFAVTLLIQYMLFKLRKNHNHGPNGIWVGSSAIIVCKRKIASTCSKSSDVR